MQKIKLMLIAIGIFSIIGGALAFKAKKASLWRVCSGPSPFNCPNLDFFMTTTIWGTNAVWYTTTFANSCDGVWDCATQTYLTRE